MKKALSLILALVMALGCMSITAFAKEVDVDTTKFLPANGDTSPAVSELTKYRLFVVECSGDIYEYVAATSIKDIAKDTVATFNMEHTDNEYCEYGKMGPFDCYYMKAGAYIGTENDKLSVPDDFSFSDAYLLGFYYGNAETPSEYVALKCKSNNSLFFMYESYDETFGMWKEYTVPTYSTDITLTVAKELTYDMVIPEDVTNLNAAGIYSVGQAKVANVKNATDKTVISYTAETTAFKCEGKTDIPASYYTDEAGQNAFPTTAVEVYKNKVDVASIPTMYVGISETDYSAAESGTYTATVTFNFSAEDVEAPVVVTAADALVTGAQFRITGIADFGGRTIVGTFENTGSGFTCVSFADNGVVFDPGAACSCALSGDIINFFYGIEYYFGVNIYLNNNKYENTMGTFTSFEVKPAGATEFTEVTLTEAVSG